MSVPDIVYVVRVGDRNEELRYSLRSLRNIPHGRVWIAGYRPRWVRGVGHIAVLQKPGRKHENSTRALLAACSHPEVADDLVYMNDDFFIMRPIERAPILHRGPLKTQHRFGGQSVYSRGMRQTAAILDELGCRELLSYELHVPFPIRKDRMAEVLRLPILTGKKLIALHKRTLYGNYWRIGGTKTPDCKVFGDAQFPKTTTSGFLSTTDDSFADGLVGRHIRRAFPEPSPYEGG